MRKLWNLVVKHWRGILAILGIIAGAIMVVRIVGTIRGFLGDHTVKPDRFKRLDDTHVAVKTDTGWKSVDVGALGLKSSQVAAVEVIDGGSVKVVKRNASIDEI